MVIKVNDSSVRTFILTFDVLSNTKPCLPHF